MHLVATDVLACPRCGGDHGLLVLADQLQGRQVLEGRLGCPNCRETFSIREGAANLRVDAAAEDPNIDLAPDDEERAFRVAALLGLGEQGGAVAVLGASPALLERIRSLLPRALVLGGSLSGAAPGGATDWLLLDARPAFRPSRLRGLAVLEKAPTALLEHAAGVLAPGARIVLDPAAAGAAERLRAAGLEVLLEQAGVAVASRVGRG